MMLLTGDKTAFAIITMSRELGKSIHTGDCGYQVWLLGVHSYEVHINCKVLIDNRLLTGMFASISCQINC